MILKWCIHLCCVFRIQVSLIIILNLFFIYGITATKPTTFVSTNTAASGSLTVGSETMSGTYASACNTSVNIMIAGGYLPSDAKAWGGVVVVTGNDNLTQETVSYTDTSCTTVSHRIRTIYDNITVGSAS